MLDVFGREIGEMRERIFPKLPRRFFLGGGGGKIWGLVAILLEKFPFSFLRPLATLLTSAILAFSRFTLDVYLKAFLDLD